MIIMIALMMKMVTMILLNKVMMMMTVSSINTMLIQFLDAAVASLQEGMSVNPAVRLLVGLSVLKLRHAFVKIAKSVFKK